MSWMIGLEKADSLCGSYDVRKTGNVNRDIVMKKAGPKAYIFLPYQRNGSDKEVAAEIPKPYYGDGLRAGAGTATIFCGYMT